MRETRWATITASIFAVIILFALVFEARQDVHAQTKWTGSQHAVSFTFPAISVAATTTGSIWVGDTAPHKHSVQAQTTGAPATCTFTLDTSLDGTNFYDSGTAAQTCAATQLVAVDKPALYVRVKLATLTGGTSPTVIFTYLGVN